jgi:WD40 repeat protein
VRFFPPLISLLLLRLLSLLSLSLLFWFLLFSSHLSGRIGHTKRLLHLSWNNRVENTLISIDATKVVKLWDVAGGSGVEKMQIDVAHKGLVTSVTWNNTGTQFATSCQDKKLRIIDPRSNSVVAEVADHTGAKSGRACWLGKLDLIFTSGFTRTTTRELALWDPRKMDKRIHTTKLDNPSTSTPMVLFDEDTSVAFICGKGDSTIMPYEVSHCCGGWWMCVYVCGCVCFCFVLFFVLLFFFSSSLIRLRFFGGISWLVVSSSSFVLPTSFLLYLLVWSVYNISGERRHLDCVDLVQVEGATNRHRHAAQVGV